MPLGARLLAALLALSLAGCEGVELPGVKPAVQAGAQAPGGAPARSVPPKPPTQIAVAGVVVAAPEGYCIDTRARKGNFVLLAACSAISQSPEHPAPGRMGLLSATVGKRGSADTALNPDQLAAYFRSAAGRATLSYAGDASTVTITGAEARDGVFYLALLDRAAPPQPELGPARWRALFTVNGRLVSVILHSLKEDRISRDGGMALISRFATRIRAASAG
ncbi:hypothetical protein [Oceanicola sp. 502str15]|uniref:hypothetical protein n=1 Tax=Oceanicola sp. 502str15 TaxID=2696061 RepID=UPI002095258F|nr:hypothetical protein [Oceanicola sp. 502str15]MCO6383745.1 hypothetical protein [Oceanicola sp. 502str15]